MKTASLARREENARLTVAVMELMKDEKTPMAKRMTQTAKSLSRALLGAISLVAGVNCVSVQCMEAA